MVSRNAKRIETNSYRPNGMTLACMIWFYLSIAIAIVLAVLCCLSVIPSICILAALGFLVSSVEGKYWQDHGEGMIIPVAFIFQEDYLEVEYFWMFLKRKNRCNYENIEVIKRRKKEALVIGFKRTNHVRSFFTQNNKLFTKELIDELSLEFNNRGITIEPEPRYFF